MAATHKKILVFLALTFAFSSVFYYLIASAGELGDATLLGLMWSPGVAALITQLIFNGSLRGLGWKLGPGRYLLVGYGLPAVIALLASGIMWVTGVGALDPSELLARASAQDIRGISSPVALLVIYLGIMLTWGMLQSLFTALGEEIGWRGLLVPELSKVNSFTMTALISGAVWAVWHYPLIFLADYHNLGAPLWLSVVCFTVLVFGVSIICAWLRLKSGSVWPAVLLHASHNLFNPEIFMPLTRGNPLTPYFIDEFGILLPAVTIVIAFYFWTRRREVEKPPASAASAQTAHTHADPAQAGL